MKQQTLTAIACLAILLASAAFATPPRSPAATDTPRPGQWLGRDGQVLPFTTHAEVLDFLRTAEITGSELIPGTSSRPLKLTLEQDGVQARAIFRTVNVERDKMVNVDPKHARGFRDNYLFEVAAYELSRLLGIDNVPPATLRTIGREDGSIQLWVEQAQGVEQRLENGIDPRFEKLWLFQKQNMVLFDILIYNFDRNPGNMLIDARGKLWLVDHTRSFKFLPSLIHRGDLKVCERRLWEGLRDLDSAAVNEALAPYLRQTEIDALLKRQQKLVKMIEKRIAQHGEQAVLFELVRS